MKENRIKRIEWIPVSERLPKDKGEKLLTVDYGDGLYIGVGCHMDECWFGIDDVTGTIIAWAELPELYMKEEEKKFGFCKDCKWCQYKNLDNFPAVPILECHNPESQDCGKETYIGHGCENWKNW